MAFSLIEAAVGCEELHKEFKQAKFWLHIEEIFISKTKS